MADCGSMGNARPLAFPFFVLGRKPVVMEHLALYRKYRPQTFGELVGQDDSAHILRNAVISGRTVHAYLFAEPEVPAKPALRGFWRRH